MKKGKSIKGADYQTLAVIRIQCLARRYFARQKIRGIYSSTYVKLWDPETLMFSYLNKKTSEVYKTLPKFLGDGYELEAIADRNLKAPVNYNPGNQDTSKAYALVITCNSFPIGNWETMDTEATNKDHLFLENFLTHDFICRLRPDNVKFLKDPTTDEVVGNLKIMKKKCSKNGFLFIYICTHILTILNGEKENKKENTYFAFQDSVWGKPEEMASSCVSLSTLIRLLNNIKTKRKTIMLNYAHNPPPRKTLFSNPRILYPHPYFIFTLASQTNSAIIGSCTVGSHIQDIIQHSAPHLFQHDGLYLSNETLKHLKQLAVKNQKEDTVIIDRLIENGEKDKSVVYDKLLTDWEVQPEAEIQSSPRPVKPVAVWAKNAQTNYDIKIDLPSQQNRDLYARSMLYWRIRTFFGAPVNVIKRNYRSFQKTRLSSPKQVSLSDNKHSHTLFGKAVAFCLKGGASKVDKEEVILEDFFLSLHNEVKKFVLSLREDMVAKSTRDKLNKETSTNTMTSISSIGEADSASNVYSINQSPILVLPPNGLELLKNPICFKIGAPCTPEKPWIIKVGRTEVLLEWSMPPFDGIKPTKYKIYMRNVTRNFNKWTEIYYPGDITKTTFLIRNLPLGVACQFKVSAYNNGGWGSMSEHTNMITPGEEFDPIPDDQRWERLREGGVLAILDRFDYVPTHSGEFIKGLKIIYGYGANDSGFKNSKISLKVANACLHALKIFTLDPQIIGYSLLVLVWCLKKKGERRVRALIVSADILTTVSDLVKKYRTDVKVMGAILALRGNMPNNFFESIPDCEITYLNPPPEDETNDDSDYEDDDEEEKEEEKKEDEEEYTQEEKKN